MNAKKGRAPCGHAGTHVTANFITCDQKCHKMIEDDFSFLLEEDTPLICHYCPACRSPETEPFDLGPTYYLSNPWAPVVDYHCCDCGHCWAV